MSIASFFKEIKEETRLVTWPSRKQVVVTTVAVIIISLFVAYYLGFFDYLFAQGLTKLLNK